MSGKMLRAQLTCGHWMNFRRTPNTAANHTCRVCSPATLQKIVKGTLTRDPDKGK